MGGGDLIQFPAKYRDRRGRRRSCPTPCKVIPISEHIRKREREEFMRRTEARQIWLFQRDAERKVVDAFLRASYRIPDISVLPGLIPGIPKNEVFAAVSRLRARGVLP